MSKLQQEFCRILLAKKIELKKENKNLEGVSMSTIGRWQYGKNSPLLENVEELCKLNEITPPYFFDGNIENLMAYNKKIGEKMGFKIQIIFE